MKTDDYRITTKYAALTPDADGRQKLAILLRRLQDEARADHAGRVHANGHREDGLEPLRLEQNTRDSHLTLAFGLDLRPTDALRMLADATPLFLPSRSVHFTRLFLCPKADPAKEGYGLLMLSPEPGSEDYRRLAEFKACLAASVMPPDTRDVGTRRMRERLEAGATLEAAALETMLPHVTVAVNADAGHGPFERVWPALADGGHLPVSIDLTFDEATVSGSLVADGREHRVLLMHRF